MHKCYIFKSSSSHYLITCICLHSLFICLHSIPPWANTTVNKNVKFKRERKEKSLCTYFKCDWLLAAEGVLVNSHSFSLFLCLSLFVLSLFILLCFSVFIFCRILSLSQSVFLFSRASLCSSSSPSCTLRRYVKHRLHYHCEHLMLILSLVIECLLNKWLWSWSWRLGP